jgi:hypothetical protein
MFMRVSIVSVLAISVLAEQEIDHMCDKYKTKFNELDKALEFCRCHRDFINTSLAESHKTKLNYNDDTIARLQAKMTNYMGDGEDIQQVLEILSFVNKDERWCDSALWVVYFMKMNEMVEVAKADGKKQVRFDPSTLIINSQAYAMQYQCAGAVG